jgi:transcriptional antiterminator
MTGKKTYYVEKVLNNNSILTKDDRNNIAILMGKGIGFNSKADTYTTIDGSSVERAFFNFDETLKNQLVNMISSYDEDIIMISNEIIRLAESTFGELNQHIHVSLTDHLSFALDQLKSGQEVANPFISQIQALLADEYRIGLRAREIIHERCGISIPDDEVGFIAFHINAARKNIKVKNVVKEIRIYKVVIGMIEEAFGIALDPDRRSDLYLIIQSYANNQSLPLQFLFRDLEPGRIEKSPNGPLLERIFAYFDEQTDVRLTEEQEKIVSAYINNIS